MSTTTDETLKGLLETAKGARLSPADEEQAFKLLKEAVLSGKKGLEITLEALVVLPWSLGVKAVAEAWPEMKPTAHRQLVAGLAKLDSEQGKRMRLSIARGLFALDKPTAIKLILGYCVQMDTANAKERQSFSNVLVGKTKPWILGLPLAELKPADSTSLVKCVLAACLQAPAFTQVWIFGWLSEAGLLDKLSDEQVASIAAGVKRWQPRWQKELKKTVPVLPAPIEEALVAPEPTELPAPAAKAPAPLPKYPGRVIPPRAPQQPREPQAEREPREVSEAPEAETEEPQAPAQPKAGREQRSAPSQPHSQQDPRDSRRGGQRPGTPFDLQRSLAEIQSYVAGLKTELQQFKSQSRQREPRRAQPREQEQPTSEELENLRRHNAQLEETAAQLRRDIEELISDHEDRAATLESSGDLQQFKSLLGVKLGKDFFDFEALRRESATEVVRRHLGDLLGHIFEVLKTEGVEFQDLE